MRALGLALLAVSVASGCAPEYQEPPAPLVPLVEPSVELTQPTLPSSTTTTVPAPTTTVLQLQPTPTLYAPGTEVELTPEQFFALFGRWPDCFDLPNDPTCV